MKLTKLFYLLTFLLLAWSGTEVLGQCNNVYGIEVQANPSCSTAANGRIRVRGNTTNVSSITSYLWSTGETTSSIGNLAAGNYSVTVTTSNGCVYPVPSTYLPASNGINFFISSQQECNSLKFLKYGTYVGYKYLWSTGDTTPNIYNLPAGNYFLTVTSPEGCVEVRQSIIDYDPISVAHTSTAATCNNSNGTADLIIMGGKSPYRVEWRKKNTNNVISTVEDPNNLPAGLYQARIYDANNCYLNYEVRIGGPAVNLSITGASCGLSNGQLIADIQGMSTPSYLWSNGVTTSVNNNLGAGIYTVTVSDANCTVQGSGNVSTGGNIQVYIRDSIINCNQPKLHVTAYGGSQPTTYSYLWNTGETTALIATEVGKDYSVTVTDAAGCSGTAQVLNYRYLRGINTSATVQNNTCGNNDGAINLTVNGRYAMLEWQPTGATTEDISNLTSGEYILTIYDHNACSRQDTFYVGNTVTVEQTETSCGLNNGTASVITHNMANPTYNWSNGATTASINNLTAGTYTVTVTDNSCSVVETVTITNAGSLSAAIQPSNPCQPAYLEAVATGAASPYTYLWNDGSTNQQLSNPAVGTTYAVTITDANGCTDNASFLVPSFPIPTATHTVVDATCSNANGQTTIVPSGGAAPYSYQWSAVGGNTATAIGFLPGLYGATVTDNNGCEVEVPNIVIGGQTVIVRDFITHPIGNSSTGVISLVVSNVNNPTYAWSNGATTEDLINIGAGNYTVTITDGNCVTVKNYTLTNSLGSNLSIIDGYVKNTDPVPSCSGGEAFSYRMVRLQPSGQIAFTNSSGYYYFYVSTPGNYSVEYILNDPLDVIFCPTSNSIVINGVSMGNSYNLNNFYITPPPIEDLVVRIGGYSRTRRGSDYSSSIIMYNRGNRVRSGTVEYNYDSNLNYNSQILPTGVQLIAHDTTNNQLSWSFSNLYPRRSYIIDIDFDVPISVFMGTQLNNTATINPTVGDANPIDNTDAQTITVVAAYDPNDKQVDLYRTGNAWDGGSIYTTDNTLEYTIRFQNTGTAPAQFVVVRDTLDVNLLPETVRELDSKHDMEVSLEDGNILVFTFNNINLPDSSVSQEQSIGFIHFKIDRVAGLPVGTQISNQAAIYFDYNTPIFTNTPISVIDQFTSVIDLKKEAFEVQAQPNPFEQNLLVKYELKRASEVQVKLYNQLGQCVYQQAYAQQGAGAQQLFLTTKNLTSGLYILQVETEEGRSSKKLIKK